MSLRACFLGAAFVIAASLPVRAAIYADDATSTNTTSFGSGILTGAPDSGGEWLGIGFDPPSALGSITFEFFNPVIDGPGADLRVYEVFQDPQLPDETFSVELSTDGIAFFLLGQFDAVNSIIDIAGAFTDPFRFVRLTNTTELASADIDALEAFYLAPVPLPAALPLFAATIGAAGFAQWRKRRRKAVA